MSVIRYVFTHYGSDEKIESHIESDNLWEQKPHNRIERKEIAVLRVSLPKTGPLPFGSENQFPSNFAHEYILVQK